MKESKKINLEVNVMNEKGFESQVKVLFQQWQILKDDLSNGVVEYNDTEQLINEYTFFKVFADLFKNASNLVEISLSNVKQMYRGVSGEIDLENFERMIPKLEFATKHNRMNPPGEVFIYLGVLGKDKGKSENITKKVVVKTVLNEIRALKNTQATICKFEVNELAKEKKVLNICGDISIPVTEDELVDYISRKTRAGKDKGKLAHILANLYFNIFSNDQIFKPVHSNEEETRKYEYAPFHALANYIKEQGYAGMMFRSTVHQNGTNLVLFEPSDVQVIKESMEHINTSEYMI